MNKQDKQDLQLIEYRLDEQDKRVDLLHTEFNSKLGDIHEDIKFIKLNTQHRKSTTKWRTIVGGGVIALMIDMVWDMFTK